MTETMDNQNSRQATVKDSGRTGQSHIMADEFSNRKRRGFLQTIWRKFLTGLLTVVPLAATFWLLRWIFQTVDGFTSPLMQLAFGIHVPGIGFVATLLLIFLTGIISSNIVGKRLIRGMESFIVRIPVIKQLYGGIRDIMDSLHHAGQTPFLQVVLIEWPKPGMKTFAFITQEFKDQNGRSMLNVLIPTVPNLTGGFLEILTEDEVWRTDLTVNEALKLMLSMGRVIPGDFAAKLEPRTAAKVFEPTAEHMRRTPR